MMNNKAIISTVFTMAIFFITSVSTAGETQTLLGNHLILAQAHDHDKDNGHSNEHDHNKGDDHDDKKKKKKGEDKDDSDYAHMIIAHSDTLQLSDEQLGQIVRLHLKSKKEHGALKSSMKKSMKAFMKEAKTLSSSAQQLQEIGKKHVADFDAMIKHHTNEREAINAVLTSDQIKLLATLDFGHDSHDNGHDHH